MTTTYHPIPPPAPAEFERIWVCPDCNARVLTLLFAPGRGWVGACEHQPTCPSFMTEAGIAAVVRTARQCGLTRFGVTHRRNTTLADMIKEWRGR